MDQIPVASAQLLLNVHLFLALTPNFFFSHRSCSKDIMNILEHDTKTLEQIIDGIWIVNIVLCFLTPYDKDMLYSDKFSDIARNYILPGFIFDVLSILTLIFDYEHRWMYYLKFLRAYYFPRCMGILSNTIDPVVTKCNISK